MLVPGRLLALPVAVAHLVAARAAPELRVAGSAVVTASVGCTMPVLVTPAGTTALLRLSDDWPRGKPTSSVGEPHREILLQPLEETFLVNVICVSFVFECHFNATLHKPAPSINFRPVGVAFELAVRMNN